MQNYIDKSLDKDFLQIEGLKYLPWVGKDFENQEVKILLIPESVYNWGKDKEARKVADEAINNNNFARIVAYEHGIEYPSSKRKLARNIEKLFDIDYKNNDERIDFWRSIVFHELVQRPLKNIIERPNNKDYELGALVLTRIIEILKPKKCIFFGTTWSKFANFRKSLTQNYTVNEKHFHKTNNAYPKILFLRELDSKIYFIRHPSKGFSPELWKEFIFKN